MMLPDQINLAIINGKNEDKNIQIQNKHIFNWGISGVDTSEDTHR